MTEIDLEDVPRDVSSIVNNVDHLCDVAKQGGILAIANYCEELYEASDKLVDLSIKLASVRKCQDATGKNN